MPLVSAFWHVAIPDDKARHKHTYIFKETFQTPHPLFLKRFVQKNSRKLGQMTDVEETDLPSSFFLTVEAKHTEQ